MRRLPCVSLLPAAPAEGRHPARRPSSSHRRRLILGLASTFGLGALSVNLAPVALIATTALDRTTLAAPHAAAAAASGTIPDEWYFSGAQRPKALRQLEGTPAPEISVKEWIGDEVSIAGSRGKVIVLDFWATWCGPCMAAIPKNVALVQSRADDGLVFIGVHDGNNGWDKAASVVRDKGINYPVARDSGESVRGYNLSFWPTYVVIDRAGMVRAAGLLPDRVGEVVEMLLAEPPPPDLAAAAPRGDAGPVEWYYGGASRPAWLREAEGKAAPKLTGTDSSEVLARRSFGTPPRDEDRRGKVVVMHFLSPRNEISLDQLAELDALNAEFAGQGVVFVGVCDSRAEWGSARRAFNERRFAIPIIRDRPPSASAGSGTPAGAATAGAMGDAAAMAEMAALEAMMASSAVRVASPVVTRTVVTGGQMVVVSGGAVPAGAVSAPAVPGAVVPGTVMPAGALPPGVAVPGAQPVAPPRPILFGATASDLGIRLAPTTVIIGRNGKVAAAGVKTDQVREVVTKLLAQPFDPSELPPEDAGTTAPATAPAPAASVPTTPATAPATVPPRAPTPKPTP